MGVSHVLRHKLWTHGDRTSSYVALIRENLIGRGTFCLRNASTVDVPAEEMAPTTTLPNTFGLWLAALLFASILLGMALLQVYLYFYWYHNDSWGIKATVITITALEITQSGLFYSSLYVVLIDGFGNFPGLDVIPWQSVGQLFFLYLATFVAQAYFSYLIYKLQKDKILFPIVIFFLSVAGLGAGIAQTVLSIKVKHFSELPSTSATSNAQAALALACDILITVGLCGRLNSSRTGVQSTNEMLNFVIMTAINRGILTMVTAALNIILFLTQPGTFYFMLVLLLSGKFYMNSMLAMLNTRKHAQALSQFGRTTVDHISMGSLAGPHNTRALNVTVTQSVITDQSTSKTEQI
ncbi:hypothetical protein B0H15DRAFT_119664 [Mycena belliarum]|uniref:DUF6534 domain-containing protein n=1 Tax=Mycena belliarum TaxID=1033014 RepID=A0AAD6TP67_9AGAR|nr:hypothetical protein B0H15DRAFT_119664 [Mycena belliae]